MTIRQWLNRQVKEGNWRRGRIMGFYGSWMSGLATLALDTGQVMCDNAPTVRALEAAFGGVIGPAHTASVKKIKGRSIYYKTDCIGILECFIPYSAPDLSQEYREENHEPS